MATNAAFQPGQQGAEPSMEEILASIRRIIADDSLGTKKDQPAPPPAAKPVEPAPVTPPPAPVAAQPVMDDIDDDVLDLADVAKVAELSDDVMVGSEEDFAEAEFPGMPEPVMVTVDEPVPAPLAPTKPLPSVSAMEDHILSRETSGLVANAFATLSRQTVMPAPGRTLEDLVSEMLRPMLRDWMDSHLPNIVERLVKAEIERVSRGG
jgi:cell pole-organizing protein PopZ